MGENVVCQTTGLPLPLRNRINWMMENSFDIVVIVDLKTNLYKYASPSHSRILGLSAQDLLGTCWLDHIHPDDIDYVADQVRLGLTAGNNSAVYRHLNKQGDYVWLHTIGSIITETEYHGDLLLVSRNIQQLKYIEEQLQESEEKYRLITDNSQDLILLLDPISLTCTFASPSISRFLGYQENEILGTSFLQHVHPLDLENVIIATRRFTFKSQDNVMQYRLLRKDGSYLWAESVGKMFRSKEDKWNLLLSTRDISKRKQAEQALLANELLLRENEKELKYQLDHVNYLINNMHEIFATYDHNQRITFVNRGHENPLGYEPEELMGRPVLSLVADSEKEKISTMINARLHTAGFDTIETLLKHKDGHEVAVRIKSSSIVKNGEIRGAMLLVEDISEHLKIEREMLRLSQLHTVGEMAASLGHEIRNPMTTVQGFLQLISQEPNMDPYQEYFNIMLEELNRVNAIITEFLSLAKNKLVDLHLQDLNSLITALYPLLQADALLCDKSVILKLEQTSPLWLDSAEIRQLLINLVRNGLEAMPAGGKVYIKTYEDGSEVVLEVQDEGSGIAPHILEKLGTPFITTKDNGTGLGLAVCYSIVARHKATIEPANGPGGTTIIIRFPIPKPLDESSPKTITGKQPEVFPGI